MELPILLFLKNHKIDYDLYLKMSSDKYVRVFKSGQDLEKDDFAKYKERNVKTVFLRSEDYTKATVVFAEKMKKSLAVRKLRIEEYTALSLFSFDKVNKIINQLGLKKEVLTLTNHVLEINMKVIEKNKALRDLLEKTFSGNSFISEHSLMLTFVTTSIAKYMGWPSVTTAEKLTVAAFFHDIKLEDDELAKIDVIDSTIEDVFDRNQIASLKNHPQQAVDLLNKFQGFPPDVDKIILQHHERVDGSGFPRGLEWKRIFALAAVFIVAEDFVLSVFESGLNEVNTEHILTELEEKYRNKGNFSLAVEALRIAMGYSKSRTLKAV